MGVRRALGAMLAAALLSGLATADSIAGPAKTNTGTSDYWIVLRSDRDGKARAYVVRPDGSRLTPLLPPVRALTPVAVSGDGSTIAYRDDHLAIYVSRANGTGVRRVVPLGFDAALSRDGSLLAFRTGEDHFRISVVDTDGRGLRRLTPGPDDLFPHWSPDGQAIVFEHDVGDADFVAVQALNGHTRVLARGDVPQWSPDGRWIAYLSGADDDQLWLVRPDGSRRHRLARKAGDAFAWSPDGAKVAFALRTGDVAVTDVEGRARRLRVSRMYANAVSWSPDGSRLALAADLQIFVVGAGGRGLRRVTSAGNNFLVAWTRVAPVRRPARPVPPPELVTGAHTLAVRGSIDEIAADGARVALVAGTTRTDCHHIAIWTPANRSVVHFGVRAPCFDVSLRDGLGDVALAGTRAAWLQTAGGNTLEQYVVSGKLPHPSIVGIADAFASEDTGTFVDGLAGSGALLAFTIEHRCTVYGQDDACPPGFHDGDVDTATVYRFGGSGPCPVGESKKACTPIATAKGMLTVLSVDAGRIAVQTDTGVRLLTSGGGVLRDFAVVPRAAVLSGNRLAVRTADAVEVYDVDSGRLAARFPAQKGLALEDLEGDVLVTASGKTVTLRRLGDGRTAAIQAGGVPRVQLEAPGLFVAAAHRVTFTPMAEIVRRLGG